MIDLDLESIKDPNRYIREQAYYNLSLANERLGEIGQAMLDALVADHPDLQQAGLQKHRQKVVSCMIRLGAKIASIGPDLVPLVKGDDEQMSAWATELLVSMAPALPVVVALELLPELDCECARLRAGVTVALGACGAAVLSAIPDVVERLGRAGRDESPLVRRRAAWALGQIGLQAGDQILPAVVELVCEALRDPAVAVRLQAAKALGGLGARAAEAHPAVVERACGALRDESLDVRRQTAESLGLMGAQAAYALPALRESKRELLLEIVITAEQAIDMIRDALHQRASS